MVRLFSRRRSPEAGAEVGADTDAGPVLVIGLGNPGSRYAGTRHNAGFDVAEELAQRWELPRARARYGGLIADGRTRPGGPRAAVLRPQTQMNASGEAAGPARGALGVPLERIVVLHDEIDLPFGEVQVKRGGGVAGHNGLRSLDQGLGGRDFWRVRIGVGRPDSTDPEVVTRHVLSRFGEPPERVRDLIASASDEAEALVERIAEGGIDE